MQSCEKGILEAPRLMDPIMLERNLRMPVAAVMLLPDGMADHPPPPSHGECRW